MKRSILAVVLITLVVPAIHADVFPPARMFGGGNPRLIDYDRYAPKTTKVVIETTNLGQQTRLLIPRKMLANLVAAAPSSGENFRLALGAALPMLGLLGFGGLCLFAIPRRAARLGLALLIVSLLIPVLLETAFAQPPVTSKAPLPTYTIPNFLLSGQVMIEIVEEGDAIRLVLNKNTPYVHKAP